MSAMEPQIALAVPAVGAVLIALTGRWPNLREAATLLAAAFSASCVKLPEISLKRPQAVPKPRWFTEKTTALCEPSIW